MNVFGFALKWRECRMHIKYKDCGLTVGLAEEFLPSMRYSRIKEKYTKHGTSLNRNEVNSGRSRYL